MVETQLSPQIMAINFALIDSAICCSKIVLQYFSLELNFNETFYGTFWSRKWSQVYNTSMPSFQPNFLFFPSASHRMKLCTLD